MIAADDVSDEIRRIQARHRLDGDGGYAAVTAIREYWHSKEPPEQDVVRDVLQGFVEHRERDVWAIAWEALVQERSVADAESLVRQVHSRAHDSSWRDDIVLGLLRMGLGQGAAYGDYIRDRLAEVGPLMLPLVAALARVSIDDSIEIASSYLVKAARAGIRKDAEPYGIGFVRHYLAVDPGLLTRLIGELMRRGPDVAAWFSVVLNDALAKPWIEEEIGRDQSLALRKEIRAAAGQPATWN